MLHGMVALLYANPSPRGFVSAIIDGLKAQAILKRRFLDMLDTFGDHDALKHHTLVKGIRLDALDALGQDDALECKAGIEGVGTESASRFRAGSR